ncbi:MAG TPA: type IV toxin-antitoxin system AbiEi family antitoxin [Lacisediminihabitans sp.]|nr:type IV toxin-antitoxin system AbiEi family antitoxin [Lacisediminihabitans sp.]HXD61246.1 type IV toxin-antitoxin system AbiEi family antitoxin [Lacisediminihabitans sp.]
MVIRSRVLSPTLCGSDLPIAELCAARLDGEVVAVAECFSPVDEPDDAQHRARALAVSIPGRLIAERFSAAWVFGACDLPPNRQQFCADSGARICLPGSSRHEVREVVIDDREILTIAGLRLTTPVRTAVDIARSSSEFGPVERRVVRALMLLGGFDAAECAASMNWRRNLPGKHLAMTRIRESAGLAA